MIAPAREDRVMQLERGGVLAIGRGTYAGPGFVCQSWLKDERIEVGRYCSIAANVSIVVGGGHACHHVTTYPFDVLERGQTEETSRTYARSKPTVIGNDVWIASGAVIGPGVEVGDGAVVGMQAVVRRNVEPYTIVFGNPAVVLRERFPPDVARGLQELRWWDWPADVVTERIDDLCSMGLWAFIEKYKDGAGAGVRG